MRELREKILLAFLVCYMLAVHATTIRRQRYDDSRHPPFLLLSICHGNTPQVRAIMGFANKVKGFMKRGKREGGEDTKRKLKSNKSVSFSDENAVHEANYCEVVDNGELFYTEEELETMKLEANDTSQLTQNYRMTVATDDSDAIAAKRAEMRSRQLGTRGKRAVLKEQERQKKTGKCDPERIAAVARPFSGTATKRAIDQAEEDRKSI